MTPPRTTRWYSLYRRLPLRDALAAERTVLANERTYLANVRTALATFLAGVTGVQLLTHEIWNALAWAFAVVGVAIFAYAWLRFRRVHQELLLLLDEHADDASGS